MSSRPSRHFPDRTFISACVVFLNAANVKNTAISAVAFVTAVGVFAAYAPCFANHAVGTSSYPAPPDANSPQPGNKGASMASVNGEYFAVPKST